MILFSPERQMSFSPVPQQMYSPPNPSILLLQNLKDNDSVKNNLNIWSSVTVFVVYLCKQCGEIQHKHWQGCCFLEPGIYPAGIAPVIKVFIHLHIFLKRETFAYNCFPPTLSQSVGPSSTESVPFSLRLHHQLDPSETDRDMISICSWYSRLSPGLCLCVPRFPSPGPIKSKFGL